jgi:hypothetical protein
MREGYTEGDGMSDDKDYIRCHHCGRKMDPKEDWDVCYECNEIICSECADVSRVSLQNSQDEEMKGKEKSPERVWMILNIK